MTIGSNTFISDSLLLLRSIIASGVSDPISGTRPTSSNFVMTDYPTRIATYPIITIKHQDFKTRRLGMRSEQNYVTMQVQVRVWARNEREKDHLTQEVYSTLRTKQTDTGTGTIDNELFGFLVNSSVSVDEEGDKPKSKIIQLQYNVIT